MRTSFMPIEFVIVSCPACARAIGDEISRAAAARPLMLSKRNTSTSPQSLKKSEADISPGPVADHERRRQPGDDRGHGGAAAFHIQDVERPAQEKDRQRDQDRADPVGHDRGGDGPR